MAVGLVFAKTRRSTRLVRHPFALVLIKPLLRRALHRVLRHKKSGPRTVALFLDLHGLETSGFSGLLPPSGKKACSDETSSLRLVMQLRRPAGSSRIKPHGLAVDDHGAAIVLRDAGHAQGRLTARPPDIWTLG
jgi:hypothetical protein